MKIQIPRARIVRAGAALLICAGTVACSPRVTHSAPEANTLIVRNASDYDVNVYIVRDAGSSGARLGTVFAHRSERLSVRPNQIAIDNTLTLAVHPVGANGRWTSPSLMLVDGMASVLELRAGPGADFSGSVFHLSSIRAAMRLLRQ